MSAHVKVCGLTRYEDAALALAEGAWALGFIFARESPRAVSLENVAEILTKLRGDARAFHAVGVFVNESMAEVVRVVRAAGLDAVQLHGEEDAAYCAALKAALPDTGVLKALRLASETELKIGQDYAGCDALLFDSFVPGVRAERDARMILRSFARRA